MKHRKLLLYLLIILIIALSLLLSEHKKSNNNIKNNINETYSTDNNDILDVSDYRNTLSEREEEEANVDPVYITNYSVLINKNISQEAVFSFREAVKYYIENELNIKAEAYTITIDENSFILANSETDFIYTFEEYEIDVFCKYSLDSDLYSMQLNKNHVYKKCFINEKDKLTNEEIDDKAIYLLPYFFDEYLRDNNGSIYETYSSFNLSYIKDSCFNNGPITYIRIKVDEIENVFFECGYENNEKYWLFIERELKDLPVNHADYTNKDFPDDDDDYSKYIIPEKTFVTPSDN